jgi:2-methylcitrate dehydratase PrpD
MSVVVELAEFLTEQGYSDLPPKAIDHAEMLLSSTIASASFGSTLASSRIIRSLEAERGGKPEATVWFGTAEKLPASAVARVNAVMSDAAASDDSDLRNIVHQGTTVCASALAVAEKMGSSGEEVLSAIVLGYEASGRISSAIKASFKPKGFHGCIIASFSATAAAARLMKLPTWETAQALALVATSVGGLGAAANSSCAREYHAGLAAMLGVQAAEAAGKGFLAEEQILEMHSGFFDVYGEKADVAAVTRDLGKRWSILSDLGIKLVPGGTPFHAIGEAAARAAQAGDVAPEDIESISVFRPGYLGFSSPQFPTDLIGIAHSAAYFAAAGATDRDFSWIHASEGKINDPVIRRLLGKVRMFEPQIDDLESFLSGAVVMIETKETKRFSATVYAPKGAALHGINWADIEAKYRALVPYAHLTGDNLEKSLHAIRDLRKLTNISDLISLLC